MGERINSPVLLANAWHHRSDAMSSVVALVGIGGACLGFPLLDPIAGICVAGMVAMTGVVSWFVCSFDEKCSRKYLLVYLSQEWMAISALFD